MSNPVFATASDLVRQFASGEQRVTPYLELLLDHIEQHNPRINAIVTLDRDDALARAKQLDAQGPQAGQTLWGLPVTMKDAWSVKGMRSTGGYPPLADHVPDRDATVVERLRGAGAIVFGKTNVPILSTDTQTHNEIFGRTDNPWNTDRTPGGSSGGSAAAVASGMSPLDIGSDIAGSVRIPAHYCGVYSLKPTEYRVSTAGHIPPLPESPRGVRRFSVAGPIARSVDDLELALRVIAGPDPRYLDIPPVPLPERTDAPALNHMRIAYADRFGHVPVTDDTTRVIHDAADRLGHGGADVEKVVPEGWTFPDVWELYGFLYWSVVGASLPPDIDVSEAEFAGFTPDSPDAFSRGAGKAVNVSLRAYGRAMLDRDRVINALDSFLEEHDVWICPVTATPAIPHIPHMSNVQVGSQTINYFEMGTYYCMPFNLTGHPVVVIPAGFSQDGLPIGLQIVGRRWDEIRLLAYARRIDEALGAYRPPPDCV
ncbi:MAG: amidase [Chloroflexi bacterium]|nr:amidase [Chloroflexota bacterium]